MGWNGVFLAEITHLAPPRRIADAASGCLVFTYGGVLRGLPMVTLLHNLLGDYTTVFAILAGISVLGLWLIHQARRSATIPPPHVTHTPKTKQR